MFLVSGVVGVVSGFAAALLHLGLHQGAGLLIGRFADVATDQVLTFSWGVLLLPAAGGLISGIIVTWLCPRESEHGTNQFIAAFHQHGGQLRLRGPATRAAMSIGVISCGGSAGPEGPIAALGAAIGSTLGRWLGLTPRQRRILLIAGCAGGVGAIFRCPLGGALFAASVLYREPEFEADSIVPALVSSVLSYSTFMLFFGFGEHMLPHADRLVFTKPVELIPYAILGALCGAVSLFYYSCLKTAESRPLRRLRLPRWFAPALGGLCVGMIGCALPQVMDGQYDFVRMAMRLFSDTAAPHQSWWAWAALFGLVAIFKCVATALTVGTGAPGGLLGPSVFIGGVTGAFLSAVIVAAYPGALPPDLAQSLVPVGMAGVLAASMRTPLAAIVMVTEMTGSYGLIVPLMLVCVTSYVIGRRWGLNGAQVRSAAESPAHAGDLLVHMLESMNVSDLMDRVWPYVVSPVTTLGAMIRAMRGGTHPVFAVTDNDRLTGIVSLPDITRVVSEPGISDVVIASDIMSPRCVAISENQNLYDVLATFKSAGQEVLPVVSSDRDGLFLGMLRRQAIHEAIRTRVEEMRQHLHREHADLHTVEQDEQLYQLMAGLSSSAPETIQHIPVPEEIVGLSLRQADFRRQYGAQVVAIQNSDGTLQCPPDINVPLRAGQVLVAILPSPAPETDSATRTPGVART